MLSKEELARYSRHLLLPEIGIAGQEKIKGAKILVIGAGGLGCPALVYLTAMGVGEIGIVDFDKVEESNLQRQILYSVEDIGKLKTEAAVSKLSKQNPFVQFNSYSVRIDNQNALELISGYDIIIDGTDNFATRYLVNDACVLMNKPLVYGSIYKFQGQVSVLNYRDDMGRSGPTYRCLFPAPPPSGSVPNCSEIGVLGVLPGIIGTFQATEAIKMITGIGEPLSGKLLLFDALAINFQMIEITRNDEWINSVPKNKQEFLKIDYEYFCGNKNNPPNPSFDKVRTGFFNGESIKSISVNELQLIFENRSQVQLLDVREPYEQPQINELVDLQIPLGNLANQSHLISKNKKVIVFCKSGVRSKHAIELLEKEFGFTNLYNLVGGVMAWQAPPDLPKGEESQRTSHTNSLPGSNSSPLGRPGGAVFINGPINPQFIADSIAKHCTKTTIGAHDIFLGQVRSDVIENKAVQLIEYTTYEGMAEEKFHEIREAAFAKYELTCMHIYHSLGRVKAGEICLFVFVSSKHRTAAFEACRYIVEEIKANVPIWGKEIFENETFVWKENKSFC